MKITFGEFFRALRKRNKLNLRQFCKEYGFDHGNISRLERGLLKPPQIQNNLEIYARSLNLKPDTPEWEQFFVLASLETGKIPSQITENPTLKEMLPSIFRKIETRPKLPWTRSTDLQIWADTLDARSCLPQLIRRLIHATLQAVEFIDFPAGEDVDRQGWDGIVRADKGNAFVPSELSCWEMGVGRNPEQKANNDFHNRSKNPTGINPKEAVFIFVTPRKFNNKKPWCEEKKKLGIWKDVLVYDSTSLEQWLEIAPHIDAWFSCPEGVSDIEEYWKTLQLFTQPSLKPEVFLATREHNISTLKNWLTGSPSLMEFEASSPDELFDFVAAYISSLDEGERYEVRADRIVIVDNKQAWRTLTASECPIVLIAKPTITDSELIAEALQRGHYVLAWKEITADPQRKGNRISRIYSFELESLLENSGVQKERASILARESGGSLTILKRRIARFSSIRTPDWAEPQFASELVPLLLAGGWNESHEADRKIIEKLCGQPYETVEEIANRWQKGQDAPLIKALSNWRFVSREDSWTLLARHITPTKLKRFEQVASEVLSEKDPMYELPPAQRWRAANYNKAAKYSVQLRKGIAETLALLVTHDESLITSPNSQAIVDAIVRKLLSEDANWQGWASLSSLLPILAEVSPEEFLKAVKRELKNSEPNISNLFSQEGDPFFSSHEYDGLLSALETLAWNRSYLRDISFILVDLATLLTRSSPEGRLVDRPLECLIQIFLPWLPQTMASVEDRIIVLKELTKYNRDMAVQILFGLLPTYLGNSSFTNRPLWRDWSLNWSERVAPKEYFKYVDSCAELLLKILETDKDRWLSFIKRFENFPPSAQDRLLSSLNDMDLNNLDIKDKQQLTEALREKISSHRNHPNAKWALPEDIVKKLEEIQKRFEPEELVARHTWLFAAFPRLPDISIYDSLEKHEEELLKRRKHVLAKIFNYKGLEGVLELVEAAGSPYTIGYVIAEGNLISSDQDILPELLIAENDNMVKFASGYARGRFDNQGWGWINNLPLAKWATDAASKLALILDFDRRTWDLVSGLGAEISGYYWSNINKYSHQLKKEDVEYAVSMLIKYHRPLQSIDIISKALFKKCELDTSFLMTSMEAGLDSWQDEKSKEPIPKDLWHCVQKIINKLQSDSQNNPDFDIERLALLEWSYLKFLDGYEAFPKTLQRFLKDDPTYFAHILTKIYRSDKEKLDSQEPPTVQQKIIADNAYSLLDSWKIVPGTLETGIVDKQQLMDWITKARQLCEESGHLEICDVKIGRILAYAPLENDGSWPCVPVRDMIEDISSDALDEGFVIGIFNKRGTVTRFPLEGGIQERELEKKYRDYAEACEIKWPRTAAALRQVAKNYEDQARREDERTNDRF